MSTEIEKKADQLHEECKHQEIVDYLEEELKKDEKNEELLWRLARGYYNAGDCDETKKKEYTMTALDYVNKGLEINDENPELLKWWAVVTAGMGDFLPAKEKISNAPKIKEYALKSLSIKPNDTVALFVLGKWSYSVASIGWLERNIANVLFGAVPQASYQEALDYFLQVYKYDPNFIRNMVSIADTYTALGDHEKAKEYYLKASKFTPKSKFEEKWVNEAKSKC